MVLAFQLALAACGLFSWWQLARAGTWQTNAGALPAWDQSWINAALAVLAIVVGAFFTTLVLMKHPVTAAAVFPIALAAGSLLVLQQSGANVRELFKDFNQAPRAALMTLIRLAPFITVALWLGKWIFQGPEEPAVDLLRNASASTKLLAIVAAGVLTPIGEELFFRGIIYRWLRGRVPVLTAAVISAVLFSAFHLAPASALALFVFGFAAAYSAEVTGGLSTPILFHAFFNLLQVGFILAS